MATADETNDVKALPAHQTKHLRLVVYPLRDNIKFELAQSDDGANNGTALWLGAQILSAFLTDALPTPRIYSPLPDDKAPSIPCSPSTTRQSRTPRAIELGSGVGLTALVLAAKGWHVLATDTSAVVLSVLRPNISRNTRQHTGRLPGTVQVRALDWTVPTEDWVWDNPLSIACRSQDENGVITNEDVGEEEELLGPPFDLIITSDTVYSPELTAPLLRTIKYLLLLSSLSSPSRQKKCHPPIYLAVEARDPPQIASFFSQAKEIWGLTSQRLPAPRVRRSMARAGLDDWERDDWEGVEVWRMHLLDS